MQVTQEENTKLSSSSGEQDGEARRVVVDGEAMAEAVDSSPLVRIYWIQA